VQAQSLFIAFTGTLFFMSSFAFWQTREIPSRTQMLDFASLLAPQLRSGDLLLLTGALGAGKTFFAQALINSLGVTEPVTSPTFVMVKNYRGIFPINHVDAYRLLDLVNPQQAFAELDIDLEDALTIVEWGADFDLTGAALRIHIQIGAGESRTLTISGTDSRWDGLTL
jgi:tRNA threonylcarbamoyladenosine biosynthesis protein TsaE